MEIQPADKSQASAAQAHRVLALKRAFQRELRHRPTTLQRTLINSASTLTARAEACALDPNCSPNDVVRISNLAARARADMFAAITAKPKALGPDSLREYLSNKQSVPA